VLLYNFKEALGSSTVQDESPLGRIGTLGSGFPGATAPKLISELPKEAPLNLTILPAVEVQFQSSLNIKYQVQTSPDMEVWSDLPEVLFGDGETISKLIPARGQRLFYRLRAVP